MSRPSGQRESAEIAVDHAPLQALVPEIAAITADCWRFEGISEGGRNGSLGCRHDSLLERGDDADPDRRPLAAAMLMIRIPSPSFAAQSRPSGAVHPRNRPRETSDSTTSSRAASRSPRPSLGAGATSSCLVPRRSMGRSDAFVRRDNEARGSSRHLGAAEDRVHCASRDAARSGAPQSFPLPQRRTCPISGRRRLYQRRWGNGAGCSGRTAQAL
jgi:hypothetical protein